jgi:Holliday junction resolvasome RuvABC endonuclease subunit
MARKKMTAAQKRRWIDYNFELFEERYRQHPYIIGMDFSLSSTGYVVLDSKTGALVEQGEIKTSTTDGTLRERLFKIYEDFSSLLEKYPASVISYEMISVFSNPTSAIRLAMVLGLMYLCVSKQFEEPPYIISAATTSLKKAATGNGRSDKNLILKAVFKNWNVDLNSDDVADAYVAARLAYEAHKVKGLYQRARDESGKDLDAFLLDVGKGRVEGMADMLKAEGVSPHMYEVVISLMGSKNQAQENDYEFYKETWEEILQ